MKKRKYSKAILFIILCILLHAPVGANPVYVTQFPADGESVAIHISVDSVEGGQPILSFQGSFLFNPAAAMLDTIFNNGVISNSGIFLYSIDSSLGQCLFAWSGVEYMPSSGLLFKPIMTVFDPGQIADSICIIKLVNMLFNEGSPEATIYYNTFLDVEETEHLIPGQFRLKQNFPNPFNPSTTIQYTLERHAHVELSIYDVSGRKTATLVDAPQRAGEYSVAWDGRNQYGNKVASGIYLYRLKANGYAAIRKMVLLK